jgi:outer membrane protein TolC
MKLPLFDGNQGEIAEAMAKREQARAYFEESLFRARTTLESARVEARSSALTLLAHESQVLSQSRSAQDLSQRALDAGAIDLWTAIQVKLRFVKADQDAIQLRLEYAVAVANLETAMGPNPPVPAPAESRPKA